MKEMKGVAPIAIAAVIIVAVVVAVVAYVVLRPPEEEVEKAITIAWTEGPEFDFVKDRIHEFEAETGIEVTLSLIPRAHIIERIMLELLSPTDAFHATCMDATELPTVAATGGLVDFYEFKPKSEWLAEGFYESQLDVPTIGGELYLIPGFWNGALLTYYRTDYFEDPTWKAEYLAWPEATMDELKVPSTPEELLEVAKFWDIVEDGVVDGMGPGGKYPIFLQATTAELGAAGAMSLFLPLSEYFGGGVYNYETGEILVNKPGSVEAMEYLAELAQHCQPTVLADGTFEAETAVREGTCIMADQWTYMIPMLDDPDEMSSEAVGKYDISMRVCPQMADMLGIAILDTPRKEMCFEFIEWMNRPEIAAGLVLACPKAPNQTGVAEYPGIAGAEWLDPLLDSYGRVHPIITPCKSPFIVEIYAATAYRLGQALTGESTPEAACAAAADDIEDIVG